MIPKDLVEKVITNITIDTVLPAIQVIVRFEEKGSFHDISRILMNRISTIVNENLPTSAELSEFYLDHIEDYQEEVKTLMKSITKCKPVSPPEPKESYKSCLQPFSKCMDGQEFISAFSPPHSDIRIREIG